MCRVKAWPPLMNVRHPMVYRCTRLHIKYGCVQTGIPPRYAEDGMPGTITR